MKAHLRKVRISNKKVNIVAGLVRGKSVDEALEALRFMPQKAAKHLYKVVQSAAANAEQNHDLKRAELAISQIIVNRGEFWRRFLPSTRGRALPLMKPTCHISVLLEKGKTSAKKEKTPTTKEPTPKSSTQKTEKKSATKSGAKKSTPKTKSDPSQSASKK